MKLENEKKSKWKKKNNENLKRKRNKTKKLSKRKKKYRSACRTFMTLDKKNTKFISKRSQNMSRKIKIC